MRRQIRMVRISFIVAAAFIVGAFYAGFYYGDSQSESVNPDVESVSETKVVEEQDGDTEKEQNEKEETVESMKILSPDKYYLKQNGEYLSAYKGTSSAVYFDTDIVVDELPETLRKLSEEGIEFDDLSSVYEFLENYSS